jgi:LuxR family maltose regulon positive regulatory protein
VQSAAFALAKIQPPSLRTQVIARDALEARLRDATLRARLTLVCAPAGFGKTIALSRLVQGLHTLPVPARAAWVSLDEDDDVQRFIGLLCAALEPFDLPWRLSPDALAGSPCESRTERRKVAGELVNALAASDLVQGVIVLDDLHRLQDPLVFEMLAMLLDLLPEAWSLVAGTRVEPPLPLSRLRSRDELAEFRQDDLRFDATEVAALLRTQPQPPDVSVDDLLARTQGWPAGLRLSLSTERRGAVASSRERGLAQRHLFDYLAAEVLDDMPGELRDFLVRCSVLPELTAERCTDVCGDARAARWLDEIERRGLFVTVLESEVLTLRLHDLFRDFLEDRLQRDHAAEYPVLLQRAAEHEPDVVRRVNLLLRAGAWPSAQQALAQAAQMLLLAGAGNQVLRLVEQFPADQRESSPLLALVRGLCAWPRFEWVTMQRAMARAAEGFGKLGAAAQCAQASTFEIVALMGMGHVNEGIERLAALRREPLDRDTESLTELMATWQAVARGPQDGLVLHLRRTLELLEGNAARGIPVAAASQWHRCAPHCMFIGRPGVLPEIERFVAGALAAAGDEHVPLRAAANSMLAWSLLWRGRFDAAEQLIESVRGDERWLGQPRNLRIPILLFQSTLGTMRGDLPGHREASLAMIADVDADAQRRATWRGVYLFNHGRSSFALGDRAGLNEAIEMLAATPHETEWPCMRGARLALRGQAALDAGRLDDALALLTDAARDSAELDTLALDATVRVTLARVQLRLGHVDAAWRAVAALLDHAQASGEVGGLLLTGRAACGELADALAPREHAARKAWLLGLSAPAPRRTHLVSASGAPGTTGRSHPAVLTDREHDVLALIAAGDSNKLIARALDLSPHTVKRHVANILDKLGLDSRGKAAAWHQARSAARP